MEVFSGYFMTVKPYIYFFLCFYRVCFASIYIYFQRFLNPNAGFSNAGAGYTFTQIEWDFFLSINREKMGFFFLSL